MVYKDLRHGSVYGKGDQIHGNVASSIAETPSQADLNIAVVNILDIWVKIDPNCIIVKPKLHVLTHLQDDVRRFGPPSLYEVEVFKSSNKVFRQCSVLSNHHALSHDIATTMARLERFKHIVSGGWWWDNVTEGYIQAGKDIIGSFDLSVALQEHLGWAPDKKQLPGNVPTLHTCMHSLFCNTRFSRQCSERGPIK